MAVELTTKEKVKSILGITSSDNDTVFTELIEGISAQVETYCNRTFTQASYTEYFDTKKGDNYIFLRNLPIDSLTSVKYRTGTWANPTWTDFNANDYLLNSGDNGVLAFAYNMPDAEKYIQVIYDGGYLIDFDNEDSATHTLPFDLVKVVTDMVAQSYQLRTSAGISSESTEGQQITYESSKNRNVIDNPIYKPYLDKYKIFNV